MKNEYTVPGITALICALLLPAYYMVGAALSPGLSLEDHMRADLGLSASDFVFLLLGAMLIYVTLSFKRVLNDHHAYYGVDSLLGMMAITLGVFHGGLFLIDVAGTFLVQSGGPETLDKLMVICGALLVSCTFVYGVIDILTGITLLRNKSRFPSIIKVFAGLTVFMSLFELTIVLSFFTLLIYPAVLLTMAVKFLKRPEMIEVV